MTAEELANLDSWGRLDLVDEVVRLRADLAAEKHYHEMTREHHAASMRAILEALGETVDPEDPEDSRVKWASLVAASLRAEVEALRASSAQHGGVVLELRYARRLCPACGGKPGSVLGRDRCQHCKGAGTVPA